LQVKPDCLIAQLSVRRRTETAENKQSAAPQRFTAPHRNAPPVVGEAIGETSVRE
jgi:hypothetical protein